MNIQNEARSGVNGFCPCFFVRCGPNRTQNAMSFIQQCPIARSRHILSSPMPQSPSRPHRPFAAPIVNQGYQDGAATVSVFHSLPMVPATPLKPHHWLLTDTPAVGGPTRKKNSGRCFHHANLGFHSTHLEHTTHPQSSHPIDHSLILIQHLIFSFCLSPFASTTTPPACSFHRSKARNHHNIFLNNPTLIASPSTRLISATTAQQPPNRPWPTFRQHMHAASVRMLTTVAARWTSTSVQMSGMVVPLQPAANPASTTTTAIPLPFLSPHNLHNPPATTLVTPPNHPNTHLNALPHPNTNPNATASTCTSNSHPLTSQSLKAGFTTFSMHRLTNIKANSASVRPPRFVPLQPALGTRIRNQPQPTMLSGTGT